MPLTNRLKAECKYVFLLPLDWILVKISHWEIDVKPYHSREKVVKLSEIAVVT